MVRFYRPPYFRHPDDKQYERIKTQQTLIENAIKVSGVTLGISTLIANRDKILDHYNKTKLPEIYENSLNYGKYNSSIYNSNSSKVRYGEFLENGKFSSLKELFHAKLLRAEQKIIPLSWMQLSSVMSPFLYNSHSNLVIPSSQILENINYYRAIIDKAKYSGYFDQFKDLIINNGLEVINGKLIIRNNNVVITKEEALLQNIKEKIANYVKEVPQTETAFEILRKNKKTSIRFALSGYTQLGKFGVNRQAKFLEFISKYKDKKSYDGIIKNVKLILDETNKYDVTGKASYLIADIKGFGKIDLGWIPALELDGSTSTRFNKLLHDLKEAGIADFNSIKVSGFKEITRASNHRKLYTPIISVKLNIPQKTVEDKYVITDAVAFLQRGMFGAYKERVMSQSYMSYTSLTLNRYKTYGKTGLDVIASNSKINLFKDIMHFNIHALSLRYFKLLDDPLEFVNQYIEILPKTIKYSKTYKKISKLFVNKLGVGGTENYHKPIFELYAKHSKLLLKNLVAPYFVTKAIHEELKPIIHGGLLAPLAYGGYAFDIARATIGKPFKYIADKLDDWAPGTSSIGVAAGNFGQFFIAGALLSPALGVARKTKLYKNTLGKAANSVYENLEAYTLKHIGFNKTNKIKKIIEEFLPEKEFGEELFKTRVEKKTIPFLENLGTHSRFVRFGLIAGIGALAMSSVNIFGGIARLLGGKKTLSQVINEYSGNTNVVQKKNRFWLFGQQPIEGDQVETLGPNWFQRIIHDYKGKTLFDKGEGGVFKAIKSTPILQDLVDPYYLERSHYRDMPYPITGADDSFGGVFGVLYANTLGKILKPTTLEHVEEWAYPQRLVESSIYKQYPLSQRRQLASEYPNIEQYNGYAPQLAIGGVGKKAIPLYEPYDSNIQFAKAYSAAMEQVGLPGYIFRSITSDPNNWFTDKKLLQSESHINSLTSQFWYQNFGDPTGWSEPWRRILQNQKTHRETINIIKNSMPDWIPDKGYYIKFQHGDPYKKIYHGYERLPGKGLLERKEFTSLKNINPEDYPDWAKLRILGDIALDSPQFKELYTKMKDEDNYAVSKINESHSFISKILPNFMKKYSKKEEDAIKAVEKNFYIKATSKQFTKYRDGGLLSRIQQKINHLILPTEELLPLAPKEKFGNVESPIEAYEHRVIYGDENASWNKPWKNFIRPFLGRIVGSVTGVTMPWVSEKRKDERFFDYIKYLKYSHAAQQEAKHGNIKEALKMKNIAATSTVAVNPYKPLIEIWNAISKEDRPYFISFIQETDPQKRKHILEMTSKDMRRIYKARWELIDYANKSKNAPNKKELQKHIAMAKKREVAISSPTILKEIDDLVSHNNEYKIPEKHWEGWSPKISLTDIKISFLNTHGKDPTDYRIRAVDIQEAESHNLDYMYDPEYGYEDEGVYNLMNDTPTIISKVKSLLPKFESIRPVKRINLYHDTRIKYRYAT